MIATRRMLALESVQSAQALEWAVEWFPVCSVYDVHRLFLCVAARTVVAAVYRDRDFRIAFGCGLVVEFHSCLAPIFS